ncbi:MAG: hypothetical protein M0Q91_04300 [Methanoregula sp.]|nr:hypothetical protein [Methanoregula sp.]
MRPPERLPRYRDTPGEDRHLPATLLTFDVTTGQKIFGPVEAKMGWLDKLPPVIPGLRKEESRDPGAD